MGARCLFGSDKNAVVIQRGECTKRYRIVHFKKWLISCHVNFTSIFLLKKRIFQERVNPSRILLTSPHLTGSQSPEVLMGGCGDEAGPTLSDGFTSWQDKSFRGSQDREKMKSASYPIG